MTQLPLATKAAAEVISALMDGPLPAWKLAKRLSYSLKYALSHARKAVPIGCEIRSWKGVRYAEYWLSSDWT